jgi:alpha-L-rhamnosidase
MKCKGMDSVGTRSMYIALISVIVATSVSCAPLARMVGSDASLRVDQLRCEYLADPLGIDTPSPRLQWIVRSNQRAQQQSAYQILVASCESMLNAREADLWNSGKVISDRTVQIEYQGKTLTSGQGCVWKVRVWNGQDRASAWSRTATWSMGLLDPGDWQAQWISFDDQTPLEASQKKMVLPPARYYRKSLTTDRKLCRATVYASALGIYELYINGQRVSDQMFTPGWSDYAKRVYYNSFDVTELLDSGENVLGAVVADGWYSGYVGYGLLVGYGPNRCGRYMYGKTPALCIQLKLEYTDGSTETVITDPSWKVSTGPLLEADMIMGETYDARAEIPGWDRPSFDDQAWDTAVLARSNPRVPATFYDKAGEKSVDLGFTAPPVLQAYASVPIRPTETIMPVEITQPEPGTYIFNLGQNFSGVVRLKTKGPRATKIRLRYGEMLHPDGRLMTENLRKARATDHYILKGDAQGETYEPRFTYHGFQYVEVTGLTEKPGLDTVTGIVVHSDTPMVSSFECSDPMVNQLFANVTWTQRANFLELPTDCPQRDERLGWTGDAQIYCRTATYNADVGAFFTKWLDDLEEAQLPNGAFPDYAPYPMMHGKPKRGFATAWADAGIICPYTIYRVYGDRRVIARHYDAMQRFMAFRQRQSPDFLGVNTGNGWGDWLSLGGKTPIEYIDAVYFAYATQLMQEMAAAIGKASDARQYQALQANIKRAFVQKYIQSTGLLSVDNQTAYVLALSVNLIPDEFLAQAQARLVKLLEQNQGRMSTGFLGTKPLLPVLTQAGQHDLAVRLLQSREFPSWGYEIENGATTIWERWNSYTKDKGFGNAAMNSFSHYAFGAVCQWMFQDLAGIDTLGPGFQHILINPQAPAPGSNPDQTPIHWVKASYESIRGPIHVHWKRTQDTFTLDLTIPANTQATVVLPTGDVTRVRESGRVLTQASKAGHIEVKEKLEQRLKLKVASGTYGFVVQLD